MRQLEAWNALAAKYPWPDSRPNDITDELVPTGWMTDGVREAHRKVVPGLQVGIELGTWRGDSALHMLSLNDELHLVCIDHFNGSTEHNSVLSRIDDGRLLASARHRLWEFRNRVIIITNNTIEGMEEVHLSSLVPEMIYVDAGHSDSAPLADILMASLRWPGSVVFGDDYATSWPNVARAVHIAASLLSRTVTQIGEAWMLCRA